MNDIDLLDIEKGSTAAGSGPMPPRTKNRRTRAALKLLAYLVVAAVIVLFVFTSRIIMSQDNPIAGTFSFLNQITRLAQTSENMLKGETDDRVNILLLGMGGKNHDGGYLTDTIMLASFQPSTNEVALLSVPRDLVIPVEGKGTRKINNINAYAEVEEPGSGGQAISQALSKVLDLPIDYYVRADFAGFVKIIDELGGVDVEVEHALDDPFYPIMGQEDNPDYNSRYHYLHVAAGRQHMDGDLALKFVRSRHGLNGEGSDFARSRRQQLVLAAVKDKILNLRILFKPRLVGNILSAASENISTNLQIWEIVKLWDMAKNVDKNNIINQALDNSVGGLLVDSIAEDGAYILTPRTGSFDEIQYLAHNIFTGAPPQDKQDVAEEYPKIEIQNGTWVNGLGQQTATDLEKYGFDILSVNNAAKQSYEQTTIFDLTYGEKMKSLTILKERLDASIHYGLPDWLIAELQTRAVGEQNLVQPDFIIILGQTADVTKSGTVNEEQ